MARTLGRSASTRSFSKHGSRALALGSVLTIVVSSLTIANTADATHGDPPNLFELDDNATDDSGPGAPEDWNTVDFTANDAVFKHDSFDAPNVDDSFTGSKDIDDISDWCWEHGNVPDKDDIENAYAALRHDGTDTYLYLGADRFATNGDSQLGFWLLKSGVAPGNTQGDCPTNAFQFTGTHHDGDILVLSDFTNGGVDATITVYQWLNGALVQALPAGGDCDDANPAVNEPSCATVNDADAPSPWPYTPKDQQGTEDVFGIGAFFEAGVNLSAYFDQIGCFTSFLAETRSSQEVGADLKDLVFANFESCDIDVVKTGDERSKVGDAANYSIQITNDGDITLYKQSIIDDVLGDLTDGTDDNIVTSDCGASLAPGASCTITLTYTVQPGDPDPLVNTVNIVYDSSSLLTGDEVSATDNHTLELFQPGVMVDKTGDTLGKVGDPADYVITVTNTSSEDSPNLINGTIVDTLLGNLLDPANPFVTGNTCTATLPTGGSCVINATRTVLQGDPDPLPNTVTVHYNPDGFPNDITDSDDHSVNLFSPSISVDKIGDALSKVGDPAAYTVMISNTSSADTPALVNASVVDSLVGDLLAGGNTAVTNNTCTAAFADGFAPAEQCTISYSYIVQPGDPDPLLNTVTVHFNPFGFPNDITDSDDHTVNLFQPSVLVEKTGDLTGKVGDPVDYTITVTNTSSGDSPNLTNGTIVDTLLGNLLDPANPFVTSSTCTTTLATGTSCVIEATRTVLPGDPDPLPNTVTVTYNPAGFPNVITSSAQHGVDLFQPSVTLSKVCDQLSKVGDSISCTVTLTNTSSEDTPDLVFDSFTDNLLGNMLGECPASLASGATCVVSYFYTVQPGDPDPLVNTATAHLHPEGFPNDITATASATINLFQPSVLVDKTGDTLGKIGDPVDYTITVTNTSSGDAPGLVNGTIVDTLLGNLLDPANPFVTSSNCTATLASGANCTIEATRTVLQGDPDPLPNTVTVHYNPNGFPNDITDSDSHSVNLFQPSVTVEKTGDLTGKVTDPVDYTITVTNTSSGDTPDLVFDSLVDTLLGDLLDAGNAFVTSNGCGATLGTGASCTVEATRTVQQGDPDPLPNTVTVHLHPEGFPNDITDSDDHSVNLFQPSISLTKVCDPLSKVGDPIGCTVTLNNTSSEDTPDLVFDSFSDNLLGSLLGCSSMPSGATCIVQYQYTVQLGDPDPLVNTATVHMHPEGFPNDITATASATINLFQPGVDVEKTGDTLGKIGDPADYTFTVTNTSSEDSPNLVNGTIVDTLLGDLLDPANPFVTASTCTATLPTGGNCVINATRTVLEGDADPLPNTVTVHYNPDGFPNDITDSDDHTVGLFQPSVTVEKTGDTLGKVTDPVDYTITVTNTSSEDSPDLVNGTIVDTLLGDLLDPANPFVTSSTCAATLPTGGSCVINATRTVEEGDADPLPNTVTVHYNPDGFPNDITDSDDHSVNLFQPSVTVEKTGDTLGKVTDPVDYTITVTNTSSEDTPDFINGTIVDTLLGDLLDPANEFVTASTCTAELAVGASCTIEATRTVVEGDPDPLPNTVTVHYNPDGFPNDITDSDDHSVNLFQPSVTVDKTGDITGTVGDPVDYTITVTNTSSDDTPDFINGTIVDTVLGDLLDPANPFVTSSTCTTTLPTGDSCVIEATRTLLASDPDPLPNTVTVHYNPDGFPNDISASDSHTVDVSPPVTVAGSTVPPTTVPVATPTSLPFTGGGLGYLYLGVVSLGAGVLFVMGARRRRTA